MNDIPYIGFIDPHAERIGRHHDRTAVEDEILLVCVSFLVRKTRMIAGGTDAGSTQLFAQFLDILSPYAVNDPALPATLADELEKAQKGISRILYREKQILPVIPGLDDIRRTHS